jgi:hypothetical protein
MTSPKDAGQVQFRKASRDFGERRSDRKRRRLVRDSHTPASISCMDVTYRSRSRTVLSTAYALRACAIKDHAMRFRQMLVSLIGFALVVGGLVYVDPRVRDHFTRLVSGGDGIASWDNRLMDLGGVLAGALRHQSIENGPLMIFAVVGAVLFLFMIRT